MGFRVRALFGYFPLIFVLTSGLVSLIFFRLLSRWMAANRAAHTGPVIYFSTDSNNALPANMEGANFATAMSGLRTTGADETLYAFANGPTGATNH